MSMNVTFRQLRLLVALDEHRSITAAAQACHVTQPTVSMQLQALAEAVGLPLYEQIGKRLFLTDAGHALVQTARTMHKEWDAFEQTVDAMKGLTRGRLRLAVVSSAKYFVPGVLGRFCEQHPEVDIALELLNRDAVVARLRENLDDLYIMSMPPSDMALQRHAFLANPLVVIAAVDHPLAGQTRLALTALSGERFIMREAGSGTRMACDAHFKAHGFEPQVRLALGSNEAIKELVAEGMGLAVMSRHALTHHPEPHRVVELDVLGFPVPSSWWTLYPQGKRLSPLAQAFLAHLSASPSL
jgi:LysR family transcriptional regulator, low CO2-responsive transcriptional regulator